MNTPTPRQGTKNASYPTAVSQSGSKFLNVFLSVRNRLRKFFSPTPKKKNKAGETNKVTGYLAYQGLRNPPPLFPRRQILLNQILEQDLPQAQQSEWSQTAFHIPQSEH